MRQDFSVQLRRFGALIYWLLSLLMAITVIQVYRSGYYGAILLPSLLAPSLAALGVWRWLAPSQTHYDPAALLGLFGFMLFLIFQPLGFNEALPYYYAGFFFPLIAFYLLPNSASLVLSLLLLAGLLYWHLSLESIDFVVIFSLHYLLLTAVAWLYGIRDRQKTRYLEALIERDEETQLYHRAYLYQRLLPEITRSRYMSKPLTFLLIELHQYMPLKQKAGAYYARQFIQQASAIARHNCRSGDEGYRFNTSTLVLLLPNTSLNGALVLRERLYQHLLRELNSELGLPDVSITPLTLNQEEQVESLWQRLHQPRTASSSSEASL